MKKKPACRKCGKTIQGRQKRKYCSKICFAEHIQTRQYFDCLECEKVFWRVPSQVLIHPPKFCSKTCKGRYMSEHQKGELNPSWANGVSPINRIIRYSARMKRWRIAVFGRDDYTCQICGDRGNYIQADHIKPFAYYPELRFELTNGRTLCHECHRKTKTWGRQKSEKITA